MNQSVQVLFVLLFTVSCAWAEHKERFNFRQNFQSKFEPLVKNCSKLERFAKTLGDFSYCSLMYSVPYNLCQKCFNEYQSLTTVYNSLIRMEQSENITDNNTCFNDILTRDKMQNINTYYSNAKSIWTVRNCDNCYDFTADQLIENIMITFFKLLESLEDCITEHQSNVTETCSGCASDYRDLNHYYLKLNSEYGGQMCNDIIDMMSVVRDNWSNRLNCHIVQGFDYSSLAVAILLVLGLPSALYGLGGCFCRTTGPTLLQQKRLSSINLQHEDRRMVNPIQDEEG